MHELPHQVSITQIVCSNYLSIIFFCQVMVVMELCAKGDLKKYLIAMNPK